MNCPHGARGRLRGAERRLCRRHGRDETPPDDKAGEGPKRSNLTRLTG
jgi:hypothetical protein